jgi:hypothetical protein
LTYVLPRYADNELGIGGHNGAQSTDPFTGQYVQLNNLGESSIVNMAGLSFAYYITEGLDVNLSFGMDLRSTPKKGYEEYLQTSNGMKIQGAKWMQGRVQNNWILSAGSNYHFKVTNEKIDLYGGVKVGYQHGQLTVTTPYTDEEYKYLTAGPNGLNGDDANGVTGNDINNLQDNPDAYDIDPANGELGPNADGADRVNGADIQPGSNVNVTNNANEAAALYYPRSGAGQINCITASLLVGVSYNLGGGFSLGIEFEPYAYRYSMLEVCPKGARVYQAATYANRFFASPMLKLGFRF